MEDFELHKKIEDFIAGRMTEEERKSFEVEIADNPDLAEKVEEERKLSEVLRSKTTFEFRRKLEGFNTKAKEAEKTSRAPIKVVKMNRRKMLGWAASLLLLFGVGYWFFNQNTRTNEQIFAQYFSDTEKIINSDLANERDQSSNDTSNKYTAELKKFSILLLEKKASEAKSQLQEIQLSFPKRMNKSIFNFYLGFLEYELKNYRAALNFFNQTISNKKSDALWLSAGCYLKLGERANAKIILEDLLLYEKGFKSDDAKAVLRELN